MNISPQFPVPYCNVQSAVYIFMKSSVIPISYYKIAAACTDCYLMQSFAVTYPVVIFREPKPERTQNNLILFPSFYG